MSKKKKIMGGVIGVIGFLLSPLSWWNDLFVNVPLALVFAWAVSWFEPRWFTASFILGYWATNVIGLVLMQKGAGMILREKTKAYGWRSLAVDVGISLFYTGVIVLLIHYGVLKPVAEYLK